MKFLIFVFTILFAMPVWAGQGLFGSEWTFTNPRLIELQSDDQHMSIYGMDVYSYNKSLRKQWVQLIEQKCSHCHSEYFKQNLAEIFRVWITDKIFIELIDDQFVVEVNATPMTLSQIYEHHKILQYLVFDVAKELGLEPHERLGGGHIHLDFESHFQNNEFLVRNFIVDMMNHSEMFLGPLGFDIYNAAPISLGSETSKAAFAHTLDDFDKGLITFLEFLKKIKKQYFKFPDFDTGPKSSVINVSHLLENLEGRSHSLKTIEIRGFRPQKSIYEYFLQAQLLQSRIQYLKNIKEPIPFELKDYRDSVYVIYDKETDLHTQTTSLSPQLLINTYKRYVEKSSLPWPLYRKLMPQDLQRQELHFVNTCKNLFGQ